MLGACAAATWAFLSMFAAELGAAAVTVLQAPVVALRFLQRAMSRQSRLLRKSVMRMMPKSTRKVMKETINEVSAMEDFWSKVHWLWERPLVRSMRITFSVANWGVRLPAIMAVGTAALSQFALVTSQVSLPMVAPLLLGAGYLLRTVKANASFLFPRIGVMLMLLWVIWFANSVLQNTFIILTRQRRIEARLSTSLVTLTECTSLLAAATVVLSMLGVNISGLLLPASICLAVACKDLLTNLLAGLFLFMVQPFRIGDTVSVPPASPSPSAPPGPSPAATSFGAAVAAAVPPSGMQSWFQGTCEKVDLRYTVLRQGRWRLMVPNAMFINREFLVLEEAPAEAAKPPAGKAKDSSAAAGGADAKDEHPAAVGAQSGRASVAAGAAGPGTIYASQRDMYLQNSTGGMHQPVPMYAVNAQAGAGERGPGQHQQHRQQMWGEHQHQQQVWADGMPVGVHNIVQPVFAGFLQTVAPPSDGHGGHPQGGHHVGYGGQPFGLHAGHPMLGGAGNGGHMQHQQFAYRSMDGGGPPGSSAGGPTGSGQGTHMQHFTYGAVDGGGMFGSMDGGGPPGSGAGVSRAGQGGHMQRQPHFAGYGAVDGGAPGARGGGASRSSEEGMVQQQQHFAYGAMDGGGGGASGSGPGGLVQQQQQQQQPHYGYGSMVGVPPSAHSSKSGGGSGNGNGNGNGSANGTRNEAGVSGKGAEKPAGGAQGRAASEKGDNGDGDSGPVAPRGDVQQQRPEGEPAGAEGGPAGRESAPGEAQQVGDRSQQQQGEQQQQQQQHVHANAHVSAAQGVPPGMWYSFQPPAGTMFSSYYRYAPPPQASDISGMH